MKHYQIHENAWIICILLMLLSVLSGCSKDSPSQAAPVQSIQETQQEAVEIPPSGTVVTLNQEPYYNFVDAPKIRREAMAKAGIAKLKSFYNIQYQNAVESMIDIYQKRQSYTLQNPLMILNPYGTNTTGLYIYFTTELPVSIEYTITTHEEAIPDFTRLLYTNKNGDALTRQEGVIIGLVPGKACTLTLNAYDTDGSLVDSAVFELQVEPYSSVKETILTPGRETDFEALEDGLFVLFGYDRRNKQEPRHLLFYDNYGVIRAEIPLKVQNADFRVETVGSNLIFPCSDSQLALMAPSGKILALYKAEGYIFHHDFAYSEETNKLMVLANKLSEDTKEDLVLTLDLTNGTWSETLDFKQLLPGAYFRAVKPKNESKLDWLHLNTIQMIDGDDVIVSSRELSSIIRVNDVTTKPFVDYIIAEESIWTGTGHEDLLLKQIGDFPNTGGQHTVTYRKDSFLPNGQYYLSMFNNNYGVSTTWKSFDWSIIHGIGLYNQPPKGSYYYNYQIDSVNRTYELTDSFLVPYSRIVASTQHYGSHIVVCSGVNKTYGEYSSEGALLAEYQMDVDQFTYRVMKYSMEQFWFNSSIASKAGEQDSQSSFAAGSSSTITVEESTNNEFDDYSSSEENIKGNDYNDFE